MFVHSNMYVITLQTPTGSLTRADIARYPSVVWPHTIIKVSWTVLPCPPHNSDVALLNCHFFDPVKNAIHG
jgi:hypothetical protein